MTQHAVTCAGCGQNFTAARSTARWCTATCKKRAQRAAKAAGAVAELEAAAAAAQADQLEDGSPAEHRLVRAARLELEVAGVLHTVNGQLALQLARQMANPEGTGLSALSKEFRAVMAAALEKRPTPEDPTEPEAPVQADDELDEIRRRREEARQAAGLA